MTRLTLNAAIPALALCFAAPALAQSATIKIDDLNLATAAGRATLEARTATLSRKLCAADLTGTRLSNSSERDACIASVRQQVAQRVAARAPALTSGG